jgi:hypothetical protein
MLLYIGALCIHEWSLFTDRQVIALDAMRRKLYRDIAFTYFEGASMPGPLPNPH